MFNLGAVNTPLLSMCILSLSLVLTLRWWLAYEPILVVPSPLNDIPLVWVSLAISEEVASVQGDWFWVLPPLSNTWAVKPWFLPVIYLTL